MFTDAALLCRNPGKDVLVTKPTGALEIEYHDPAPAELTARVRAELAPALVAAQRGLEEAARQADAESDPLLKQVLAAEARRLQTAVDDLRARIVAG